VKAKVGRSFPLPRETARRKSCRANSHKSMMCQGQIASCVAGLLLLTPAFAQRDGQWHRFQQQRPLASQNQPGHAGNWLRRYKDLPPDQQHRALQNDPQFRRLPPAQQERLEQRLRYFSSLPPAQQERMLKRMEIWEHMTAEQKQQARQVFQEFKQLPPDRRFAVNRAIREMRGLTPEQRDQLIDSERFRNEFSPQERHMLTGAAHLPLAPGEGDAPQE